MFEIFRLICKDRKLLSDQEFKTWCDEKKKKGKERPYDGDYGIYKSERLKELIFKK
jgi:hypothetical protein